MNDNEANMHSSETYFKQRTTLPHKYRLYNAIPVDYKISFVQGLERLLKLIDILHETTAYNNSGCQEDLVAYFQISQDKWRIHLKIAVIW